MKSVKKILLTEVPGVVTDVLREQLSGLDGIDAACTGAFGADTDLVITAGGGTFSGCPVLRLSFSSLLRLGDTLRQVSQMLAQPVLHMDDVQLGGHIFRPREKSCTRTDGSVVILTDRETDILAYLVRHHARPVGRDELLKNVWQYQEGVDTHTLETHIYRLRQKIEAVGQPQFLLNTDGGYSLAVSSVVA